MTNNAPGIHRVVCFGEVLWDILPSGAVPGGAPMNVTYHLHKLGKNPALITKTGTDQKGDELVGFFSGRGICTDYFQKDLQYETGKVFAHPNEHNEVEYDIVKPVAWDFINREDKLEILVKNADYFVFGSLAARSAVSKDTLFRLLGAATKKVLDINLRPPHYNRAITEELLRQADFLKLNMAELELIAGWYFDHTDTRDRINSLRDKFNIPGIVVTMGAGGAVLAISDDYTSDAGIKVTVADTVGSGDAFLAGLLSCFLDNKTGEQSLGFACGLGAFIATQKGACPDYDLDDVYKLIASGNHAV